MSKSTLVCELLNVQHSDFDAPFGEQEDDSFADAIGTSGHNDDLLLPVPVVALPVVDDLVVEPAAEGVEHAQGKEGLQVAQGGAMLRSKNRALRRVFGGEEQRQCNEGVEGRGLKQTDGGVERPACDGVSTVFTRRLQ